MNAAFSFRAGRWWCGLVTLFWLASAIAAPAQEKPLDPQLKKQVRDRAEAFAQEQGIPGLSLAIGLNNELVYANGWGLADVENQVPVTEQTRFRTASIAKSLTAVLIMQLQEEGKLQLDDEVQTHCAGFPGKQYPVTIGQVLGHLGGIRHYRSAAEASSTDHYFSLDSALKVFASDPLRHEPGTAYLYSSFGYNLLGSVAEGAGGADFMSLLQTHVLAPAAMEQTVADDTLAVIANRTRGYIRYTADQLRSFPADHNLQPGQLYNAPLHDTSMKIPGGGLLSTPADLVRFASALNRGELLESATRETMWTVQQTAAGKATGYGLGWRVASHRGQRMVTHSGGQSGTSTILVLFPETGLSVAVMCNLQNRRLLDLATGLADLFLAASGPQDVLEKLEAAIRHEVQQQQLPAFSISLIDDQQVLWAEGFGHQDAEQKIPATAETIYRVGSISKLLTDISVMKLVESGKLDLDAPVTDYLPDFQPQTDPQRPITLRHLMTHRSGLVRESPVGNYFDPTEPTLAQTVASLNGTPLAYPTGTRTKYSNAAIAVVGQVLEHALQGRHAELVQREIFQPLGMHDSSFDLTSAVDSKLATAWMWTYDGRRFEAPRFLLGTGPAGNLYSNVLDLSRFVSLIFQDGQGPNGPLLSSQTLEQMTSPQLDEAGKALDFGIGFRVGELDGHRLIGHGGAVYGFSTQLEALPDRKLGVVAASSLDGSNGVVTRLSHYALRLMLAWKDGQPLPDYVRTAPIEAARTRALAGDYRQVDGDRWARITQLAGEAYLQRGTFRQRLLARASDGAIVTDDPLGFGAQVKQIDAQTLAIDDQRYQREPDEMPMDIPDRWRGLIGEYGWDHNTLYILEDHGQLYALIEWFYYYPLTEVGPNEFRFPDYGLYHGEGLTFTRDSAGRATEVVAAQVAFVRREVGTKNGETFKITPVKPIDELRQAALSARPPEERGPFRDSDLVDVTALEPGIRLDIRYATTNNFTGAVFYRQPRAFLQRPAAQALQEAQQRLQRRGLGLLIHDAYRPWHVTRMFWDATPAEMKDFVANPAQGSRHNRGCAVDLTLAELETGRPIEMVAGYDEFSPRSFPLYPGGTSRQRWYRRLLRDTMEAVGFSVYEFEWWHFDYRDWKQYRIGNQTFEEIEGR